GFLWAEDLSTYDSVMELGFSIPMYGDHVSLFTLLMTVSIFAFTLINQRAQGTMTNNPVMKWFPYIMPLIFLGFLNNYSAGLSWYYLISNLISITQTLVTKRFIDEEKLLQQMRDTAKKKKKGKKGKSRVERWAEQQQKKRAEMQKARANNRRGGGGGGGKRRK
ncbi:MAG: YidC/Oxa1 family membrane protein insertase, partial [Bacteroidota bacterium]